jgi:uncharacterized protein with PIN domain
MKFMTDANLGSLTKWLRIFGYDTVCWRGDADRRFLTQAQKEGRVALTRKKELAGRQYSGRLLLLQSDLAKDQIGEVLKAFSLYPDPDGLFSVCLKCNEFLDEVEKEAVEGRIPAYIYSYHTHFRICPSCKKIYWPGSHKERALDFLKHLRP